jgi:monoamine oxidase
VKRRKVLKSLGLGLSAGLLVPELLISCKKGDPGPAIRFNGTVVVIGAGAAGLFTADILRSKGITCIVLEASARAGGRVKSFKITDTPDAALVFDPSQAPIADFPLELGADVIYGSDSNWGTIIRDITIASNDLSGTTNRFVLDNVVKAASELGGDSDFIAVENFVSGLPSQSSSGVSVKNAAGVSERGQGLLNAQAANLYGSSSERVDAGGLGSSLKLVTHDGKWLTLKATQMQDAVISRFAQVSNQVQYNTVVKSIDYSGDVIAIVDKDGKTTSAQKVVVTVPLSVLKSGAISFSPGLPGEMTASMAKLGMDSCIRVLIDFKKNFWGNSTGFIWGGTTAPQYFNAGVGRSELNSTLCITIFGPKAAQLSAMSSINAITTILTELDAIYGGQATENIRRNLTTNAMLFVLEDWSKEPYILGGISYPMLGATLDDRAAIGQPQKGKLFFAGEATDISGDAGTISGALASAERAAAEVIKSITG